MAAWCSTGNRNRKQRPDGRRRSCRPARRAVSADLSLSLRYLPMKPWLPCCTVGLCLACAGWVSSCDSHPREAPRQPAAPALAPTAPAVEVAALHREWILVGWERKPGDGPLDFRRKLGKYYDFTDPDVLLYDDFDPQHRVVRSAAAYGAIWEPAFSALRSARHRVSIEPAVLVDDALATSTLQFEARLESEAGKVTGIRTLSSLVWHATEAGWKIVREHNSTVVVPVGEVEANLNADGGG